MADAGTRLELYVRSLAPGGRRSQYDAVLDRLKTLSAEDVIADYSVYVCGKRIPADREAMKTPFGVFLYDRIAIIERWAANNDIPLDSLFRRQHIDSTLCGESDPEMVLPTMVLAEYEGPSLRFVAPCETEHGFWTVQNRLQALSTGDISAGVEPLPNAIDDQTVSEQAEHPRQLLSSQ